MAPLYYNPGVTAVRLVTLVSVLTMAGLAQAGDGSLVWRTLESAHFVVHYHDPLADVGRRVVAVAERSHTVLAPVFDHAPAEKTHIVLRDTTDGANGFASVLPRNQITLFATAPRGNSVLNDHDDWLYALTAHEYTHILHLDSIGGLPFWYNKVLGKTWAPNQIQPRWVIEGLATHEESKRTSGGRTRSALFDMELRVAVLSNKPIDLDSMSSGPQAWPHGSTPYLYGGHFLKYVFDRFGEDRVKDMSWAFGSSPIPYGLNHSIRKATGERFDVLYEDWLEYMRSKYQNQLEAIERRGRMEGRRITFSGEGTRDPRFVASGKYIVFRESDGRSRARLRSIPVGQNAAKVSDYAVVDRAGGFDVLADGSLVVEQAMNFRTNYSFQDLVLWNKKSAELVRITRGARARDPAVSPDERLVAFSMNTPAKSKIAVVPLHADATPVVVYEGAGRYDQVFAPEWSPDGRKIVFSAWRAGGFRDIVMVDRESKEVQELTRDRALDTDPVFSPDGRFVYFSSDRNGVYNVYAYELATKRILQVTNVLGCALNPEVSPDGKRLIYQGFDVGGYDLYELELEPAKWRPAEIFIDDRPEPKRVEAIGAGVQSRAYRPLESLAPRSYTVNLATTSLGKSLTLQTQGNDIVGWHGYSMAATLLLDSGGIAAASSYYYNRFWPSFRFAMSRNSARRGGLVIDGENTIFNEEVVGATTGVSLPMLRNPTARASLTVDYDFDWLRNTDDDFGAPDPNELVPRLPETDVFIAGLALRFTYNDSRGFTYTVGRQEGKVIALSMRLNHTALGGDFDSVNLNYRFEWYRSLPFSTTASLATRFVGGVRASNRRRTGVFALGGVPEQNIVDSVLNNLRAGNTGFLRGFPQRSILGTQFHMLNLELRQQLVNVEQGLSTLPIYFRRLHLAALRDVGDAFDGEVDFTQFNLSVGGALRADLVFGYLVPGSLDIGYSRGLTTDGVGEFWLLLTGTL